MSHSLSWMAAVITGKINGNMVADSILGPPNNTNQQVTIPNLQIKHSLSDSEMPDYHHVT